MFWYITLFVLAAIFSLITLALMLAFWVCDCDRSIAVLLIIAILISGGCWDGCEQTEKANTTTSVATVQVEVMKMDITEERGNYTSNKHYYMSVKNGDNSYVLSISAKEYANYEVGDNVEVEVTTETNHLTNETRVSATLTEAYKIH